MVGAALVEEADEFWPSPVGRYPLVTRDDFSEPLNGSFRDFHRAALFYLPRCESRFQIIMLKCRRHAVDFAFGETMPCGFIAPLGDGLTDVCGYFAGLPACSSKYPATSIASASEAVLSSSLIAVLR